MHENYVHISEEINDAMRDEAVQKSSTVLLYMTHRQLSDTTSKKRQKLTDTQLYVALSWAAPRIFRWGTKQDS